ncbi:MAG: HPr family phosphocarrier protein [Lachnospiraceae bacterium]|nr:HPr family phosphocarrier protein [Lachnospiraceae bacterium]MBR4994327.1 HPr family phosphocarrier protein [Lachnospiraceae bacterium]
MVQFSYEIKDELGIHARPAGLLAKTAAGFKSSVSLQVGDATADAKKMISIMKLGAHHGQTAAFTIEGEDEEAAAEALKTFMQENL